MNLKQPSAPTGQLLDLALARKVRDEVRDKFEAKLGWEPNPCRECQRSGQDADGNPCPLCNGTGYGPQYDVLVSSAFETLGGGAKYGGKSAVGIIWLLGGNPDQPTHITYKTPTGRTRVVPLLVNQSYIYHPQYRALVLRLNQKDLNDWIAKARVIYGRFGAVPVGSPAIFRFPSGAQIETGHMDGEDAYYKYQGQEFQRMVIEELTHIPTLKHYLNLRSNVRSSIPQIRPQIYLTTNPLGPGHSWTLERFVHPKDADGSTIPAKTMIWEDWTDERTGKTGRISRIFIPMTIDDNPKADDIYRGVLLTMEEQEKQAYYYGNWDILTGNYFRLFRPRPVKGEPDNAIHVLRGPYSDKPEYKNNPAAPQLMPWWGRGIGGDWGYAHECAFEVGCWSPDHQLHVYKELVMSETSPVDAGARLATFIQPDLEGLPARSMKVWFSHEAFSRSQHNREGVTSIVELIAQGVSRVLGPHAVHIPEHGVENFASDSYDKYRKLAEAQLNIARYGLTFIHCSTDRVLGLTVMNQMMEWIPPVKIDPSLITDEFLAEVYRTRGPLAAHNMESIRRRADDGRYPRMQIWDTCPRLIEALPKFQRQDPEKGNPEDIQTQHFKSRDAGDAGRYLCAGFAFHDQAEPFDAYYERSMSAAMQQHAGDARSLYMIHVSLEAERAKRNPELQPFNLRVIPGPMRRHGDGNVIR